MCARGELEPYGAIFVFFLPNLQFSRENLKYIHFICLWLLLICLSDCIYLSQFRKILNMIYLSQFRKILNIILKNVSNMQKGQSNWKTPKDVVVTVRLRNCFDRSKLCQMFCLMFVYFLSLIIVTWLIDELGSAYLTSFILDGRWNDHAILMSLEAFEKAVSSSDNLVSVHSFPLF